MWQTTHIAGWGYDDTEDENLIKIEQDVPGKKSTYKKCLREEWGKFTGYQLLSSFWLKVARTDEDGNTTR